MTTLEQEMKLAQKKQAPPSAKAEVDTQFYRVARTGFLTFVLVGIAKLALEWWKISLPVAPVWMLTWAGVELAAHVSSRVALPWFAAAQSKTQARLVVMATREEVMTYDPAAHGK